MRNANGVSEAKVIRKPVGKDARRSKHQEVFDTLSSEIASGRLLPGDRIPTEAELSKIFSASRATIARAMRELKVRGLLVRQRGGGTRIARPASVKRIALFAPFASNISQLGLLGTQLFAHLSELASQRSDDLRVQFLGRRGSDLLEQMLSAVDELLEHDVNGVLFYPAELPPEQAHYNTRVIEKFKEAERALVLVDRDIVTFPQRSGLPLISFDYRRSGYAIANHLLQNGCRRIVFVGRGNTSARVMEQISGCLDALTGANIHPESGWIWPAVEEDLTAEFCKRLMQRAKPDAIICEVDHFASTLGRHLTEQGLKIGHDIAVSGFSDEPIAAALPVPLTTVRFPIEPLASFCYERLLKQMANPALPDTGRTLIDVELVVRGSSKLKSTKTKSV